MGNFLSALKVAFEHEYPQGVEWDVVNTPGDKGGLTAPSGITFATMKAVLGARADLDGDGDVDAEDFRIFAHNREAQISLLHREYWLKPGFDNIRNSVVSAKVFDIAVHAGPRAAVVLLQRAVNHVLPFGRERLKEDGRLGPVTLATLSMCDSELLVPAICAEQANFYLAIIERDPTQAKFKTNWLSRARWPGPRRIV